ncbi:DUF2116 family Zn-ribbon domain-containing protein [Shewanella algae]|uniref:DUF2116 family Zn-ribbon domain-containing protein n=1 Tax=Shewanella algae TaxID=38313 RepID=UPI003003B90C
MSNDADEAQRVSELFDSLAIAQARKPAQTAASTGRCLYCSTPVAAEARFCDADCRDDFERLQQLKARA